MTGDFKDGNFPGGDRHALYVGWVGMRAAMNGLDVAIDVDENGFYRPNLIISFPSQHGHKPHKLTVVVPPPPEDWTIDD